MGLSHLGTVSSICWASLGCQVVGVDADKTRVEEIAHGRLPIQELGLDDLLSAHRAGITFTHDFSALSACDLVVFALDVDTDESDRSDRTRLETLIEAAVPWLEEDAAVVLMSQVPAGYTRELRERIRARRPDLPFSMYYWVETLVIGEAVERCLHPERLILGSGHADEELHPALASALALFDAPVVRMAFESAEIAKAAINLYLSASVTVANTLADLCEAVGASMREVVPALRQDRRIGPYAYLRPGLGVGGGNLERDLSSLHELGTDHDVDMSLVRDLITLNAERFGWVHRQLGKHVFTDAPHPTIAFWGLTYKKNTSSTKKSPALRLAGDLAKRADLRLYDPAVHHVAGLGPARFCVDRYAAVEGADCLLVLTDWDEFAESDWGAIREAMAGRVVVDAVSVVDADRAVAAGFRYVTVGERDA